jgi:hypothetical protein
MEYCLICCDEKNKDNFYTCNSCKFTNCIDCHKTYLLSVTQDAHCLKAGCRVVIPFDIFLSKFGQKWVFGKYKDHRHKILWEREQALMPATVEVAANSRKIKNLENQIKLLKNEIKENEDEMALYNTLPSRYAYLVQNKKTTKLQIKKVERELNEARYENARLNHSDDIKKEKKYNYKYRCPVDNCKGYLNDTNICILCENTICMNCYSLKEKDKSHTCNKEKVDTFKAIKKEAKPCPSCGEFISKISGCDQMFCVGCGTAFSWTTGEIELGIIHNPHAHTFFKNNPNAMNQYNQNRRNDGAVAAGGDGACRDHLPENFFFYHLKNSFYSAVNYRNFHKISGEHLKEKLWQFHRHISEFRQYCHRRMTRYITNPLNTNNQDLRIKYLNNEYDDRMINIYLHKRDKIEYFNKQIFKMLIATYEIAEFMFWAFYDEMGASSGSQLEKTEIIHKYFHLFNNLIDDTNQNVEELCTQFNYIYHDAISFDFEYNNYYNRY